MFRLLKVVLRDYPTNSDAAVESHVERYGIEHLSSHILKVNNDAIGEIPSQSQCQA
ncbi:hypothetical protein Pfo_018256 [Paulownia fortunei]|nr:hypothetical protein Pfo_018256 [Paulownia fortunei]